MPIVPRRSSWSLVCCKDKTSPFFSVFFSFGTSKNQNIGIKNTWICKRVFIFFIFYQACFLHNLEKSHVFTGSKVRWLSFEPQEFVAAHFKIPLTRMFCEAFFLTTFQPANKCKLFFGFRIIEGGRKNAWFLFLPSSVFCRMSDDHRMFFF